LFLLSPIVLISQYISLGFFQLPKGTYSVSCSLK
jgi:hypothetical protein